jgi:hypothetical protein
VADEVMTLTVPDGKIQFAFPSGKVLNVPDIFDFHEELDKVWEGVKDKTEADHMTARRAFVKDKYGVDLSNTEARMLTGFVPLAEAKKNATWMEPLVKMRNSRGSTGSTASDD